MSVDLRKFASGIAALRRQHGATYQFDDALVRLVWKCFGIRNLKFEAVASRSTAFPDCIRIEFYALGQGQLTVKLTPRDDRLNIRAHVDPLAIPDWVVTATRSRLPLFPHRH